MGVPLIVIVLPDKAAVTPAGRPVAAPIPVAPVVVCVMFVKGVLIHSEGLLDAAPAVFRFTVNALLAVAVQPPAFVTVTVYVPAVETVIAAVVAPVLHA